MCTRSSIEIQLPSRIIVGSPGTKLPDISSKEKEGEGPCKSSVRNSWYKRQVRLTQTCCGTFFISLFVYLSMTDTQKWNVWKIWIRKKSMIPPNIVHQKQWRQISLRCCIYSNLLWAMVYFFYHMDIDELVILWQYSVVSLLVYCTCTWFVHWGKAVSYLQSLVHCGNRGTIARYRQCTSENEFSERRCNALRYCAGAIVYRCWISPKQRRPRFSVVHRRFKSMGERSASWLMWSFASYISRAPRYPSFMHPLCSSKLETFTQLLPIPSFCNLFLYALHNLTVTMPLENRMRTPHNLQRMLILNVSFNVLLYTTFGFLGYNKYMHDVYDTVVKNLPVDVPLTQTVKITVGLAATFSFGIAYFVPISIILPKIQKRFGKITEYYDENIFRIIGATATTILAIAIPQMLPLLGFLAALSMTTIIVLIPIVIETATKWETATRFLLVKNIVIFIIWMVLFIMFRSSGLEICINRWYKITRTK